MRRVILITLVALLIIGMFLYFSAKREMLTLNREIEEKENSIRKFQTETGMVPDELVIKKIKVTNENNLKEIKKLSAVLDSRYKELPLDISDKGIFFFQSLHTTMKLLERKATAKKMIIPPVFFSVEIPKEEDIPYLLKQVEMIEEIMSIIIEVGKCEVETIKPMPIETKEKIVDFNKLGVQITLKIDSDSFVNVLSKINKHIPLYIIEDFSVSSIDQNRLEANFIAYRILTGASLEDFREYKDIVDLNSLYPLKLEFNSFSKRNPFFRFKEASSQGGQISASTQSVPTAPQFTYKGSIFMKDKLTAIIEDNWQNKVYFVESGESCSGYKVLSIEEDKVVLAKDGQEIILIK